MEKYLNLKRLYNAGIEDLYYGGKITEDGSFFREKDVMYGDFTTPVINGEKKNRIIKWRYEPDLELYSIEVTEEGTEKIGCILLEPKEYNTIFPDIDVCGKIGEYTILNRHTSFEPYIVAYGYNEDDGTWAQGHYFGEFEDAVIYAVAKLAEKTPTTNNMSVIARNYKNAVRAGRSEYAVDVCHDGKFQYQVDVFETEEKAREFIENKDNALTWGYYRIGKITRDVNDQEISCETIYEAIIQ